MSGSISDSRIPTYRHIALHIIFSMTILPILDFDGFNALEDFAELIGLDGLLNTVDLVSLKEACLRLVDIPR